MKEWPWEVWLAILGGIATAATGLIFLWKLVSGLVDAARSVERFPLLEKKVEKLGTDLRHEAKTEAERLKSEMDARFATLEKENRQSMEEIRTSVDSRFEMVVHMLSGLKDGMHDSLSGLEKQLASVSTNIEWLKRSADSHPPPERERKAR